MVQTCRWNSPHFPGYLYMYINRLLLSTQLTTWPFSFHVIWLFSDKNQFIMQYLATLVIFCMKKTPFKWEQGTFVVIYHDGLYIYRYTFPMVQYTFIGWVWTAPAAHMYEVHVRDTPLPPGGGGGALAPLQWTEVTNQTVVVSSIGTFKPRHEKTCLRGFRPGKTQTVLRSHRT